MVKKRQYINNKDLTQAISDYQKLCKNCEKMGQPIPIMPKYIGECIMQICNRLTRGFGFDFTAYSFRPEMVLDAIDRCVYAVMKFDADRSSSGAFSYLTTVAINAMKKRIIDEEKEHYIKHKNFQTLAMFDISADNPDDNSDKVIAKFENRQIEKKKRQIEKRKLELTSNVPHNKMKRVAKKK